MSRSLIWLLALSLLPTSACLADADIRPIVVLRTDDAPKSWRDIFPGFGGTSALEYGKSKHIPITWGIITSECGTRGLTWAELRDYLDTAGGEAASHSVTHSAMGSIQAYVDEVVNSKAIIDANLGPVHNCTSFLQPGPWTGAANMDEYGELYNPIGEAIQATYAQSMSYLFGGWAVGDTHYRYGSGCPFALDYSPALSETSVQAILDVVERSPGLVFVISSHGIQATGGTTAYAVPANIMKYFMDHAAKLRDEGKIRLMSLRDAYAQSFPSNLNRVSNPGFDVSTPGYTNPCVPWKTLGGASIVEGQGIDGSRCGRVAGSGAKVSSGILIVPPGRYELSWSQSCEQDYPLNSPLTVVSANYTEPYSSTNKLPSSYAQFYSGYGDTWETKRCLLRTRDKLPQLTVAFQGTAASGVRVDNVSLVSKPVDPGTCPSNLSWTVNPTGGSISWDTPADPSVTTIECRYGQRTHPMSLSEGVSLGTVAAAPGTRQEMTFSMDWTSPPSMYGVYFSVFAKGSGGASEPEIDYVVIDRTPPVVMCSTYIEFGPLREAIVTWSISDAESPVRRTRYAVGHSTGGSDVVPWTDPVTSPLVLGGLPPDGKLHLSMQSQNQFGFWSPVTDSVLDYRDGMSYALSMPDGTTVEVTGVVSAVFGDGFYIEQPDRARAVKVRGGAPAVEGSTVVITGALTTTNGERVITVE